MVLQFNPPPYKDPDEEISRLWGQAFSNAGQNVLDVQNQKRNRELQELQMEILRREEARKSAEESRKMIETCEDGPRAARRATGPRARM